MGLSFLDSSGDCLSSPHKQDQQSTLKKTNIAKNIGTNTSTSIHKFYQPKFWIARDLFVPNKKMVQERFLGTLHFFLWMAWADVPEPWSEKPPLGPRVRYIQIESYGIFLKTLER